ncbi:TetR/AcrR family transcriptional regulator [Mucilaginibacter ginsenosidivorax]|uniref:TetR/AcrR family transcriptional regulator n=1 Tax=Mucilaginibacter ginsenosidivorax TaxID=862126 RepID=A0A5B8W7H0_9SPHI|nr:TetR/AcrR family transcriptional regulator [Mucilaginibacter ginsenosidivorax]QEC78886.1 TetR/AcrR family transcriptional regulator [Mucilaginibacter ginsenosidivorax]
MGKAENTKQHIINEAALIFNQKGIAGTTVDDVLKAAKVARGCLYSYFETKDALAIETVGFLLKKIIDKNAEILTRPKTAKDKIYAYLNFNKNAADTFITGGHPVFNFAVESDNNNPVIKKMVKDAMITIQKMLTGILISGVKSGELSPDLKPKDFAIKLYSMVEGCVVVCRILETNTPLDNVIKSIKTELNSYCLEH